MAITTYDHDPGATTAADVAWVDMSKYHRFAVLLIRAGQGAPGSGDIDAFQILANSESDGSGSDVVIKTHAIGSQPDAAVDFLYLECSWDEVAAASGATDTRYVSASVQAATGTDEFVVAYILADPRYGAADLTTDQIA